MTKALTRWRRLGTVGWRVEFKSEDLWIGVFWRRSSPGLDLWICLLPTLPIHCCVIE